MFSKTHLIFNSIDITLVDQLYVNLLAIYPLSQKIALTRIEFWGFAEGITPDWNVDSCHRFGLV